MKAQHGEMRCMGKFNLNAIMNFLVFLVDGFIRLLIYFLSKLYLRNAV